MVDNRPSKKQRELLQFIEGFIKGYGYGPSYREIMRALGYKSVSTVAVHVDGLIARGYLYKKDHSARSIEIISPSSIALQDNWLTRRVRDRIAQGVTDEQQQSLEQALHLLNVDSSEMTKT